MNRRQPVGSRPGEEEKNMNELLYHSGGFNQTRLSSELHTTCWRRCIIGWIKRCAGGVQSRCGLSGIRRVISTITLAGAAAA